MFGLTGELKCDPTGAGRPLIVAGATLRCERAGASDCVTLASVRAHLGRLLVRLEGVGDAGAARAYAGAMLYAPRASIRLEPGEYLDADLIGCRAVGRDGRAYGRVDAVEHFPASDMLVVSGTLVPMVAAIVAGIDLTTREIVLDPPLGLFPDG